MRDILVSERVAQIEREKEVGRPVVRATLLCRHCAYVFTRDFTVADQLCDYLMGYVPAPIANTRVTRRSTVRFWFFWTREKVEETRAPIACPNCTRRSCAVTGRQPIEIERTGEGA